MSYKTSLFIFTRDLRLEDNTGLIEALKSSEKVIPVFIFNPEQISEENSYKSDNDILLYVLNSDLKNDEIERKIEPISLLKCSKQKVIANQIALSDIMK